MPQIKLGFDKRTIPSKTNLRELQDYPSGSVLLSEGGTPLYTEVEEPVSELTKAINSTSVYFNNSLKEPLKIAEQFAESSEVSTTLLGVSRAETQLSLFSDVSTYGLNPEEWEFYDSPGITRRPGEWYNRFNPIYGNHGRSELIEETNEQALVIRSYPVAYSYPEPPRSNGYNETLYDLFKNFITLGNIYYNNYVTKNKEFAEKYFLNPAMINASTTSGDPVFFNEELSDTEVFNLIEKWTMAWLAIRDNELFDPETNTPIRFIQGYNTTNTRPGYSSTEKYFGRLQSKKAYRYQPGRISGYTFGFKCSTDENSSNNIVEWGVINNTDQYVFQIKGSNFGVVRRSTIKLPDELVTSYGLTQTESLSNDPLDETLYNTVEIPSDNFNGDPLNGNGPSGYALDPTKVTMYKIEFGWYGAIGAKFYAYVPFDTGGARWILLHTLIIENQVGVPCLADPYFKFGYSLTINDTAFLKEPQFVYKYGASCYIDGGNDNAGNVYSYDSAEKFLSSTSQYRSLMGVYPKFNLKNFQGDEITNKKNIYLTDLKITVDQLTKIQVEEVTGCPGFGHHYSPSLHTGINGRTVSLRLINNNQFELVDNDGIWDENDNDAKIILNGIWNTYLNLGDGPFASLARILENYDKIKNEALPSDILVNGVRYDLDSFDFSSVRLSRYDAYAASDYRITGKELAINFLNPNRRDGSHYADFFIGITNKAPIEVFNEDTEQLELKFQGPSDSEPVDFSLDYMLYEEYTSVDVFYDRNGFERGEDQAYRNKKMIVDYRLPRPEGEDSGLCSTVTLSILEKLSYNVTYTNTLPTGGTGNYLIFSSVPSFLLGPVGIQNSELGILQDGNIVGSTITIISEVVLQYTDEQSNTNVFYIEISSIPAEETFDIFLTPIQLSGTGFTKVKFFDYISKPLYVVVGLRDNARVNNITFLEKTADSSVAISPNWISNEAMTVVASGGSSINTSSTNFIDYDRLASASIDTELLQPLRPSRVLTTFYASQNETVSLSNVYGPDRTQISPGLLNNKATFITAKNVENNNLNSVSINLNTRED